MCLSFPQLYDRVIRDRRRHADGLYYFWDRLGIYDIPSAAAIIALYLVTERHGPDYNLVSSELYDKTPIAYVMEENKRGEGTLSKYVDSECEQEDVHYTGSCLDEMKRESPDYILTERYRGNTYCASLVINDDNFVIKFCQVSEGKA